MDLLKNYGLGFEKDWILQINNLQKYDHMNQTKLQEQYELSK